MKVAQASSLYRQIAAHAAVKLGKDMEVTQGRRTIGGIQAGTLCYVAGYRLEALCYIARRPSGAPGQELEV